MIVQVDLYKDTGKYYTGGTVDIGSTPTYETWEVLQAILDNQKIVHKGYVHQFYMVVTNVSDDDPFCMRLYFPEQIRRYEL